MVPVCCHCVCVQCAPCAVCSSDLTVSRYAVSQELLHRVPTYCPPSLRRLYKSAAPSVEPKCAACLGATFQPQDVAAFHASQACREARHGICDLLVMSPTLGDADCPSRALTIMFTRVPLGPNPPMQVCWVPRHASHSRNAAHPCTYCTPSSQSQCALYGPSSQICKPVSRDDGATVATTCLSGPPISWRRCYIVIAAMARKVRRTMMMPSSLTSPIIIHSQWSAPNHAAVGRRGGGGHILPVFPFPAWSRPRSASAS